jgi:light-harvesting complex I chlorophyll a/b binding protein 1
MKLAITAVLIGSAAAFNTPPLTFAVGKKVAKKAAPKAPAKKAAATKVVATKAPAKKAAATKALPSFFSKAAAKPAAKKVAKKVAPVAVAAAATGSIPSTAIPGELAPALLDGSLPGDVGFDPCYLSTKADLLTNYFNGIIGGAGPDGLTWYREAELMHGRICMVAVVGFLWPGLFGTFSGNEWTGADAYSYTNALEAFDKAPSAALFQIFSFMGILEFRRINIILADGPGYQAGASQKWGQGDDQFWNPLGLDYSPDMPRSNCKKSSTPGWQ